MRDSRCGIRLVERQLVGQQSLLDLMQDADRADGVLVDRVDVVEAVLHLRDDAAELWQKAAQHAGLVHPPQRVFRVLARGQNGHEQGVRRGRFAQIRPIRQIAGHHVQGLGVNVQLALLGHVEQAQHGQRVTLEQVRLGGRDLAGLDHHAVDPAPTEAESAQVQARVALVLHLERGAEDAGQRADLLRDQVVVLHEPLDGARRARSR